MTRPRPAADTAAAVTRATDVYDRLRGELLDGSREPGSRLAIEALAERFDISPTPLREALNRLVSEGLVERREQRGFVVAPVGLDDLDEITRTRCWLEEIALRRSIAAHTPAWEDALVLAHHHLARTPRSLSDHRFVDNPEWEPRHRAFHRALIAGCGSRWLIGFCEQLADQHHRYRRLAAARAFAKRGVKAEHQQLLQAALDGRADEAVALLVQHYERTARLIGDDPRLAGDGHT